MLAGLMYHKPDDPISFMEDCLAKARNCKDGVYDWKLFHSEGISNAPINWMSWTSDGSIQVTSADNAPSQTQTQREEQASNGSIEDTSGKTEEQKMNEVLKKPILFVLGESSCELSLT